MILGGVYEFIVILLVLEEKFADDPYFKNMSHFTHTSKVLILTPSPRNKKTSQRNIFHVILYNLWKRYCSWE